MDGRDGSGGNRVAVNVLGTMGAVFWSIQLLPQLYINWRKKDTTGLQPSMMLLWAFAGLPLGVHNILADENVALQVQAQILTLLSLLTWSQVMFYGHKWSLSKSTIVVLLIALAFGAVEAAIVCGIKYGTKEQVPKWTLDLFASLAAAGLGMGVLRHYYDIYTHRSVRGISFFFVGLDAAGDLTSLISVGESSLPSISRP
ncbi:hypothetical protein FA10DRAFT_66763 [Acaromyces ingoldii]|uniref:PQ-loop-domain-containing protein n=1 Tax=Acaromyces ingoldii TaxID=215250 RepID=A0A316YQ51_9BASI|nr:hypothetical protein FA10DRAFT_66763 [Acaromyces ingoldii]PWN91419.1 hypothetical protein FA10DRAFT_66763 [Acaromyces ingoldii]